MKPVKPGWVLLLCFCALVGVVIIGLGLSSPAPPPPKQQPTMVIQHGGVCDPAKCEMLI